VSSIIKILEELIPVGCCQSIYFSDKYFKSYECKLLGLSEKFNINLNNDKNLFDDDLNDYVYLKIDINPKNLNLLSELQILNTFDQTLSMIKEKYFIDISIKTNVTMKSEHSK
jgi:hypothetical protein